MNMKKIAVNFSGAVRTFAYCADSIIKNIIQVLREEYEVYIFGDFWILKEKNMKHDMKWKKDCSESIDKIKIFGFNEYNIEEYDSEWEKKIISQCNGQEILDEYQKIKNENDKESYIGYAMNCMGMYFKIKKAQELMENYETVNNINFDYVIRIRPDFYWNDKIPLDLISKLDDNNILLVKDSYCINAKWEGNDKFFMAKYNVMKKYAKVFDKIKYFFNKNIRIEGQNIAKYMIKEMDLQILFFGDDKTYDKATGKFIKHKFKIRL